MKRVYIVFTFITLTLSSALLQIESNQPFHNQIFLFPGRSTTSSLSLPLSLSLTISATHFLSLSLSLSTLYFSFLFPTHTHTPFSSPHLSVLPHHLTSMIFFFSSEIHFLFRKPLYFSLSLSLYTNKSKNL